MPAKQQVSKNSRAPWIWAAVAVLVIASAAAGVIYWRLTATAVSIDNSLVSAPLIELSPTISGKLQKVFVNEGDLVAANAPVAQVGNELVKAKVAGQIVSVPNTIGSLVNAGQTAVQMIDPSQLRIVGRLDENKGLDRIAIGDRASFTVDAFGGKQYSGVVDEIAPTAVSSGVVFNISDQRPTQQFDIKVRFDTSAYPELRNGMSARLTVYPN